ncbi:polysaccharide deacetylase family protein [Candidatus Avelusimicrobium sp.]
MNLPSFFSFPKESTLKVLRIGKIGPGGISLQRLEKLFIRLGKTKTYSLLPKELKKPRKKSGRPVILLFTGGYQRFLHVIPLLDKYGLKAVLALPVGLIGQYDSWQEPHQGPWQDLLTQEQIKHLSKNPNIAFATMGMDGTNLQNLPQDIAIWQLTESKVRLERLCAQAVTATFFAQKDPTDFAVLSAAAQHYEWIFTHQKGNHVFPPERSLKTIPVRRFRPFMWI